MKCDRRAKEEKHELIYAVRELLELLTGPENCTACGSWKGHRLEGTDDAVELNCVSCGHNAFS